MSIMKFPDPALHYSRGDSFLAISDADMPASAYVDGKLIVGSCHGEEKDTLTVIKLPLTISGTPDRDVEMSELDLPNSVIGSPFALAVSPDGGVAYVLETFGEAPEGVESVANVFDDFPRDKRPPVRGHFRPDESKEDR